MPYKKRGNARCSVKAVFNGRIVYGAGLLRGNIRACKPRAVEFRKVHDPKICLDMPPKGKKFDPVALQQRDLVLYKEIINASRTAGGSLPLPVRLKKLSAESLGNIARIISSRTAVRVLPP